MLKHKNILSTKTELSLSVSSKDSKQHRSNLAYPAIQRFPSSKKHSTQTKQDQQTETMQANKMTDRGSDALKTHLSDCEKLVMKQTRRGWCQECLGCEVSEIIEISTRWRMIYVSTEHKARPMLEILEFSRAKRYFFLFLFTLSKTRMVFLTLLDFCLIVSQILPLQAKTEFKYYIGKEQVAHSLEDAGCCCRMFCGPIHP